MLQTSKVPKIRNAANFVLRPADVEHSYGQSLTVQDDTVSLKTLVEQYTKGGMVPGNIKEGSFPLEDAMLDDVDLEKYRQLDLFDQSEISSVMREALKERINMRKAEAAKRVEALNEAKPIKEEREEPKVPRGLSSHHDDDDDDVTTLPRKGKK